MNAKHIYSVLALTVLGFFGGWAVFNGLLGEFYANHSITYDGLEREEPLMWAFAAGSVVSAVLLVYVLHHAKATTIGSGLLAGMVLGFLVSAMIDLYNYGAMNLFNGTALIVDIVVNTAFVGILGAIGAWILGMGSKAQSEAGPSTTL